MRFKVCAAVAALCLSGCSNGLAPPARDAYKAATAINNGLALSLDATALVKRGEVAKEARAGMAKCPPSDAACREQSVRDAMSHASGTLDKIDAAAKLQHELAGTLERLSQCVAESPQPDGTCERAVLSLALEQIPRVIDAVKAVKEAQGNVAAQ
jgi:hypothetical protein